MTTYKTYIYSSILAPYIKSFVEEKRLLGFSYDTYSYHLYRFDSYWSNNNYNDCHLTSERLENWICAFPGESKSSQSGRIYAVKRLAVYLIAHGISCDVPLINVGKDQIKIHIMDNTEREQFFEVVDSYVPVSIYKEDYRMAGEYPVLFRLLYCCGMRNNEVCSMKTEDVDLEKGIITIYNGKQHKDRLIYLSDDMKSLLSKYHVWLKNELEYEPYWLFPGRFPEKHIINTTVDRKFRELWNKTPASQYCDKSPTPHSLRHGFVVDKINNWILEEVDLDVMFIYLSKYLGHSNPDETYYYYHLAKDAFRIVHQKDTVTEKVLPEVRKL